MAHEAFDQDPAFGLPGRGLMPADHPDWLRPEWDAARRRRADDDARRRHQRGRIREHEPARRPGRQPGRGGARKPVVAVFAAAIGARPVWLNQVHGAAVVRLRPELFGQLPTADASITTEPGLACTVQVADCLPVLFAAPVQHSRAASAPPTPAGAAGRRRGRSHDRRTVCDAAACAPGELTGLARALHRAAPVRGRGRGAARPSAPTTARRSGLLHGACGAGQAGADLAGWRASGGGGRVVAPGRRRLVHGRASLALLLVPPRPRHRPHGRGRLAGAPRLRLPLNPPFHVPRPRAARACDAAAFIR